MRIFVYGTLRQGQHNHKLIADQPYIGTAATHAQFTLYGKNAGFPYMARDGKQVVYGEVYEVDAKALRLLDTLEGHPRHYQRTPIQLQDGTTAEAYTVDSSVPRLTGRGVIVSGDWLNQ